jgi:hypothetical protein
VNRLHSSASLLGLLALVLAGLVGAPSARPARGPLPPGPRPLSLRSAPAAALDRAARCSEDAVPWPGIRLRGDDGIELPAAVEALERVLATSVGAQARALLASAALREPVTIELNRTGDNFTRYRDPGRELGETIAFDPWTWRLVETDAGARPALPETILAHELGHALFKLDSEADVIQGVENPVRAELGLPRRTRF